MKSIFLSKTFWFNALSAVLAVAMFFGFSPNQEVTESTTNALNNPMLMVIFTSIGNMVLRLVTTQPVFVMKQPEQY